MVPFLGPRTTRSLIGTIGDMVMDPVGTLAESGSLQTVNQLRTPVAAVDFRARTFDAFNNVKYNAIDPIHALDRFIIRQEPACLRTG